MKIDKKYDYYKNNVITRINYIFFSSFRSQVDNHNSFLKNILIFFKQCLRSFIKIQIHKPDIKKIIFFSTSINNNKSLEPIWNQLKTEDYCLWLYDNIFPQTIINYYSLLFLLIFFKTYFKLDKEDKMVVNQFFDVFIRTYATFYYVRKLINHNKTNIELVVMANDHSMTNRCLLEACEMSNVKTLYIQHASVTERFPPLLFTYSFLDGEDSFDKYYTIGNLSSMIFLSGINRFSKIQKKESISDSIGIAINELDDMEKVVDLALFLKKESNLNVIVRPHPAQNLPASITNTFIENNIDISNSKKENTNVFLNNICYLVANESSIHLDASFSRTPSILYNLSNTTDIIDYYNYIKNGLIKYVNNKQDILLWLKTKPEVDLNILKKYDASITTKYCNSVSNIVSGFIETLVNNEDLNFYINNYFHKENYYYVYNEN